MGHGGYLQVYNGTPYKWVRERHVSSVQMKQWDNIWPLEMLPNTKYLIYIEYDWRVFTKLSKTIAKVKYVFEEYNVENTPSDIQSVTQAAPPKPTDMWIKFKALAHPEFDLFAIFSDNVKMLKMDHLPSTLLFPTPPEYQLTSENDDDHLRYQETIGWYHNDIVFFYLTQSPFIPNHFTTSLNLPRHADFSPKNWMTKYYDDIKGVPVKHLAIPGTHNSGSYTITSRTVGGTSNNTVTQRLSIYEQLTSGCRFLDLRPVLWKDTFYMGHYSKVSSTRALGTNGASFITMIDDINRFTNECDPITGATLNNELIIIMISHDFNANDGYRQLNQGEWNNLFGLLQGNLKFMRTDLLETIHSSSFSDATLSQFLAKTPRIQFANEDLYGSDSLPVHIPNGEEQSSQTNTQPCVLVLIEPHEPNVPLNSGLYQISSRTMRFFDRYSETLLPSKMMPDQLNHLINQNMQARHSMFILNWILTQDTNTAVWCAFGLGKGEWDLLSLSENVNPMLQYEMMLLGLHYECEWVHARENYLTLQANMGTDSSPPMVTNPIIDKPNDGQDHSRNDDVSDDEDEKDTTNRSLNLTLQPQPTKLVTFLPNHTPPNPLTPNIILVDGFSPSVTQLAVAINLWHFARIKLAQIHQQTPKTSDLHPTTTTDYHLHPFSIPPANTEFSMYIPSPKDEEDHVKNGQVVKAQDTSSLAPQPDSIPLQKVEKLLKKLQFDVPEDKVLQDLENEPIEKSIFREKSVLRVLQRDATEDDDDNLEKGQIPDDYDIEREDSYVYDEDDEEANRINDKFTDDEDDNDDDDIPEPTQILQHLTPANDIAQESHNTSQILPGIIIATPLPTTMAHNDSYNAFDQDYDEVMQDPFLSSTINAPVSDNNDDTILNDDDDVDYNAFADDSTDQLHAIINPMIDNNNLSNINQDTNPRPDVNIIAHDNFEKTSLQIGHDMDNEQGHVQQTYDHHNNNLIEPKEDDTQEAIDLDDITPEMARPDDAHNELEPQEAQIEQALLTSELDTQPIIGDGDEEDEKDPQDSQTTKPAALGKKKVKKVVKVIKKKKGV